MLPIACRHLNIWSPVGGAVWEFRRCGLTEEVQRGGWALKLKGSCHSQFAFCFLQFSWWALSFPLLLHPPGLSPSGTISPNSVFYKFSWSCCFMTTINRKVANTEVSTREWAIVVTDLTVLGFGGAWKTLRLCSRKVTECSKWTLMDRYSWNLHSSSIENHVDGGGSPQEVSEGINISNWASEPFCDTWQRMLLLPVQVLRSCQRLNLKVMD